MSCLVPLLLLAAQTTAPGAGDEDRHPDAVEIFHCDFGEAFDVNFDRWPDGWERRRGVGFPTYLKLDISEERAVAGSHCLRLQLDGGAATVYSPPIKAGSLFSYVLEGSLKTEKLKHDVAYYSVTFYNEKRRPLETFYSAEVGGENDWRKLRIGPITPSADETMMAVIGLHLRPTDEADLNGAALFDDVWFARLPRMTLRSNSRHNVYTDPNAVQVECEVSGILERDPLMSFELIDVTSELLASTENRLDAGVVAQKVSRASEFLTAVAGSNQEALEAEGFAGLAKWKPPIPDYGFYRVNVTMRGRKGLMQKRTISLAIIHPEPVPPGDEFGWSLPRGDDPIPLNSLSTLLGEVGIRWVKFPVWYSEKTDPDRADRLAWFVERLNAQNIEVIGLLDQPPPDQRTIFGEGEERLPAAAIFADPGMWHPVLDPVMTRLSLKVRWWQLGRDDDTSFVGYPNLDEKITEVKTYLERFGQEIHLGIPWSWMHEPPPAETPPWDVFSKTTNPPLTGSEMAAYLHEESPSEPGEHLDPKFPPPFRQRRWVVLEPLPRTQFDVDQRARDMVERMLAAKIGHADCVFVPQPFSTERGLMNDDGTPGELLLPWRTTALMVSDMEFLGAVRLPNGSPNYIFARGEEAVMVVWNQSEVVESIYLGDDVKQVDLWGQITTPETASHRQQIAAGPMPTFITGVNAAVARWRMSFQFQEKQISSMFGRPQSASYQFTNYFDIGVSGQITLDTPSVWEVDATQVRDKALDAITPGEVREEQLEIVLGPGASSGIQPIRIDFDITADKPYRFSVYREIEVGLGDIGVEINTQINEKGDLVVVQQMVNKTNRKVSFQCTLFAPNRRRLKKLVIDLGRGREAGQYILRNGQELVGKTLLLQAEEIGGDRLLNYRFEVAP